MTVDLITGTGNTDATLVSNGIMDTTMDPRAYCYCEDNILRFDPSATTTLTINNKNLMFMDTARLEMKPASSSVIHTLRFTNVVESGFTGGAAYKITAMTAPTSTTRTCTLKLRQAQPNCNLVGNADPMVARDNLVVAGCTGSTAANYNGTHPIIAVGSPSAVGGTQDVTISFTADPGAIPVLFVPGTHTTNEIVANGVAQSPAVNDKGLWIMGSAVADLIGETKLGWGRASADLPLNATAVTVLNSVTGAAADLTGWDVGDEVLISPTDYSYDHDEIRTITSVTGGNTVHFSALTYAHPRPEVKPGLFIGAEVANLTRNVRIEGQDATHRSHFMFHNEAATVQTVKYVAERYLGPREVAQGGAQGPDRKIVGRWPWHFHKQGEFSRGDLLEGCIARDCGSHAYVQHASNGVTIRDCISYHNMEESFWWDQDFVSDSPDDVLWDHNLVGWQFASGGDSRMAGFLLPQTVNDEGAELRNCAAFGVRGGHDAGGAGWNTEGPGAGTFVESAGPATVWVISGINVFHNNQFNGFGSWINAPAHRSDHHDLVLSRNGFHGLGPDGAYSTGLSYERTVQFENAWNDTQVGHAPVQWLMDAQARITDDGYWSVRSDFHIDGGGFSQALIVDEALSNGSGVLQILDLHVQNCLAPALRLDNSRTVPVHHVLSVSGSGTTRTFTLQLLATETDLRNPGGMKVSNPISTKNTVLCNFYSGNYPTPLAPYTTVVPLIAIGNPSGGAGSTQTITLQFPSDPGAPGALSFAGPNGTIYASVLQVSASQPKYQDYVRPSIRDIGASVDRDVVLADFDCQAARGPDIDPPNTPIPGTTIRVQSRDDQSAFQIYVPVDVETSADFLANRLVTTIPPFAFRVTTQFVPNGTPGVAYAPVQLASDLGQGAVTWALKYGSAALPGNLELTAGGVLQTTAGAGLTATGGTYPFTVEATDARRVTAPKTYSLLVSGTPVLQITTTSLLPGVVGTAYSKQLDATGGSGAKTWSLVSGTLPGGITLTSAGVLQGTPTTAGSFNFTIRVTDSSGTDTKALQMSVTSSNPTISTISVPIGVVGTAYSPFQLLGAGGVTPYVWSIASGTLPSGLSLSSAGVITGTPLAATSATITFRVTDFQSNVGTKDLTVTTVLPLSFPDQDLPDAPIGQVYTYVIVTSGGVPSFGCTATDIPDGMFLSVSGVLYGVPQTLGEVLIPVQIIDASNTVVNRTLSLRIKKHLHRPGRGMGIRASVFEDAGGN